MTSIDPPLDPDERIGILIEKSVRGALSEDEQRELGEALAADPRLQKELDRSIDESANIHALVERAMNEFDEETAQNAVKAEVEATKRLIWFAPLLTALIIGSFVWSSGGFASLQSPFFVLIAALMVASMLVVWIPWVRGAHRLAGAQHTSEEFRLEYAEHRTRVNNWVVVYRACAILMMIGFTLLLIESLQTGQRLMLHGAIFASGIANLYYAFSRRHVDRMRGFRLGVLDRTGRPISKKGGSDDTA
ncbi:MAG: hypothetical protein AAGD00_00975 [Planctomycetota bacterium]